MSRRLHCHSRITQTDPTTVSALALKAEAELDGNLADLSCRRPRAYDCHRRSEHINLSKPHAELCREISLCALSHECVWLYQWGLAIAFVGQGWALWADLVPCLLKLSQADWSLKRASNAPRTLTNLSAGRTPLHLYRGVRKASVA